MAVSMTDIARHAGVSASTVSYALSGKKRVSPEALRRVMRAVEELGYSRNAAAAALASGRRRTIALMVPPLASGLVATQLEFVVGVAEEASRHGYDMLLATGGDEHANIRRLMREGVVDGLIVMEVRLEDPRVELLRALEAPFVLIGRPRDSSGLAYVDADSESMVRRSVEYLHGLGHRAIAFVNLPSTLLAAGYAPAARALDAYRATCAALGIESVDRSSGAETDATARTVQALLKHGITALVTNNDDAVAGLIAALQEAGRRVPEDVSVVGILGRTKAAQPTRPQLTAIELPTAEMAATAARTLIARLDAGDGTQPAGVLFDPPLVERGSTAPLAATP
jgi:DNA-binding LacI/PurR family transcriptional regulator